MNSSIESMKIAELEEYKKDLKGLSKKYKTLPEDMEIVKKVLRVNPGEKPPFSFRVSGLSIETCIIKVKRIASKSFKGKGGNSGFRLLYAYYKNEKRIVLIELYHKSKKAIEDKKRILSHFK